MNKAELKAKADDYFNCVNCHSYADTKEELQEDVTQAYIAGYEARNEEVKILKEKVHWWKKEVNVAHRAREDEFAKLVIENKVLKRSFTEAKELLTRFIMASVYFNGKEADLVARTEQFLKEVK